MPGKSKRNRRKRRPRYGMIFGLISVIVIAGGIFLFSDIGGRTILGLTQRLVRDKTGIELVADGITGNPVRGYTINNFSLAASTGDKKEVLFAARSLSAKVSFKALLRGALRLSELSVGGVDMDIDKFLDEVQKINLPIKTSSKSVSEPEGFDVPIDRVSLKDSKFTLKSGHLEVAVAGVDADIINSRNLAIKLDGHVNKVPLTGSINMDVASGTTINVKDSDVRFGKARAKIFVIGGIAPLSKQDTSTALNLQGSVQGLELKDIASLWPEYLTPQDYDGAANVNVEARGTIDRLRVSGTLDYKGRKIAGYPVERVGANIDYDHAGGRVSVSNLHAMALNVPISGELAASLPVKDSKEKVPSVLVYLDGLDASLDGVIPNLSGQVSSFGIKIQGPINEITGTIHLAAPRVAYQGSRLTNVAAQLKLMKNNAAMIDGKFQFEGAQGYLQGSVTSFINAPRVDLTAKLVNLDLRNLPVIARRHSIEIPAQVLEYDLSGKMDSVLTIKGPISSPNLTGTLTSTGIAARTRSSTPDVSFVKPAVNFALVLGQKPQLDLFGSLDQIQAADKLNVRDLKLATSLVLQAKDGKNGVKGGLEAKELKLKNFAFRLASVGDAAISITGEGKVSANGLIPANFDLRADGIDLTALVNTITPMLEPETAKQIKVQLSGKANLALKISGTQSGYTGSGQFELGPGALTGFKYIDLAARVHGTRGLNYASVIAPFVIQTDKLIIKSGAIANAPANDPMYKYAKFNSDAVIGFDKSMNLPVEAVVNYQLINALLGGGKGTLQGIADVLKGSKNLEDSLNAIIGGGLSGTQKDGGRGDYRTVTLKVLGTFASPTVRDLHIGASTLPKNVQDSGKNKPNQSENISQDTRKKLEGQLKKKLGNQLQKGLGSLLKK